MDKRISVGLDSFYSVVLSAVGTTMLTFAVLPSVLASHVAQVALCVIETGGHTILTIGLLGAIERATTHLGGEVGAGDAEDLLGHNMIDALLQVGNLLFKARQQPFGNLTQEDTAFAARVIPGLVIVAIQLMVMKYVFGIYLGNDYLKLALFVVSAVMFSISFGVICGLCFKGNVTQRGNKATSLIMISVFLSGEMISQLPGLFEKYFPIFNKINPATVLNMALFKLTIGNSAEGFFMNIAEIIGLTVVFLAIGIAVLRREKYASV